jgi:signal transduction histidine kinase
MGMSLILLVLFEVFWLRSEYTDQKDWLQNEQSHHLHSAIRSLEDSLFQLMLLTPAHIEVDSMHFDMSHGRKVRINARDSAHFVTIVRSMDVEAAGPIDSVQWRHRTPRRPERKFSRRRTMLGALSMHLSKQQDSLASSVALADLLDDALTAHSGQAPLLDYQLVSWAEGDSLQSTGLSGRSYYDAPTNQHFAIVYPKFRSYLFKRITPQILFAVFLFACIATAFYLVYRSLLKQQRLAALRNDFINNITHELKTPVSTVRVALEALQNFDVADKPEKAREYLEISQSELDRLTLLVDKVLRVSALDQHVDLKIERVDLKSLVDQILATMKVQFQRLAAKVSFHTDGDEFELEGDRMHLTGILYNLLDNALKYSPEPAVIDVSLERQNGSLILEVTDHGQGIPQEHLDKVFDKFYRIPTGDAHNVKGHGLGLSYVARVVEQHHGKVQVQSAPGRGTTFTLKLPAKHVS